MADMGNIDRLFGNKLDDLVAKASAPGEEAASLRLLDAALSAVPAGSTYTAAELQKGAAEAAKDPGLMSIDHRFDQIQGQGLEAQTSLLNKILSENGM